MFSDVDRAQDPRSLIKYVEKANANNRQRALKEQVIKRILRPQPGEAVLDVGCGVGHDAHVLAELVGGRGHVTGIDRSQLMVQEAKKRSRYPRSRLAFLVMNGSNMECESGVFDACLIVSTMMHASRPAAMLSEVARVLKVGGRLVVFEPDWDMLVLDTGDRAVSRHLVRMLRQGVKNSGIGHQLPSLFRQAGLRNIKVECGALTASSYREINDAWRLKAILDKARRRRLCSAKQVQAWLQQVKWAAKMGCLFGASAGFAVYGRKA